MSLRLPAVSASTGLAVLAAATAAAATAYYVFFAPSGKKRARADGRRAVIAAIATAVPEETGDLKVFMDVANQVGYSPESLALMEKIAARSGIQTRHTCLDKRTFGETINRERAVLWGLHAPALAERAARAALAGWAHGGAADITHVVVHSCTGFSAPGLDFHLITALGLPSGTRKLGVNFMGCFGGFTTLFVAKQIVEADPTGTAAVLVVCCELCSLHISPDPRVELIIGNTIFGDGAAAVIVTGAAFAGKGRPPVPAAVAAAQWAIGDMASDIVPDSAHCMTWKPSPATPGLYDMWLDRDIPSKLSGLFLRSGLSMVRKVGIESPWSCAWGIHPGGKAIVKAFRTAFAALRINPEGLDASDEVLRDYGNMSSATIFFVLERVLSRTSRNSVFFAGFGPGLSIEYGCLYRGGDAALKETADPLPESAAAEASATPAPVIVTPAAVGAVAAAAADDGASTPSAIAAAAARAEAEAASSLAGSR